MDTIENIDTWKGFFALLILLVICYWLFKFIIYLTIHFTKKNATNKKITNQLNRALLVFKPLAVIFLLLDLISINPINHTIFLVAIGVFGYKSITNYINGIILKMNPLIEIGAVIDTNNYLGEIKKMIPLGIVINTETGERFISYNKIEKKGFSIKSNNNSLLRQTLYITMDYNKDKVLDLLFDSPLLNNREFPSIKNTKIDNVFKLQYSLEDGAMTEDLLQFLRTKNITSTTTIKLDN